MTTRAEKIMNLLKNKSTEGKNGSTTVLKGKFRQKEVKRKFIYKNRENNIYNKQEKVKEKIVDEKRKDDINNKQEKVTGKRFDQEGQDNMNSKHNKIRENIIYGKTEDNINNKQEKVTEKDFDQERQGNINSEPDKMRENLIEEKREDNFSNKSEKVKKTIFHENREDSISNKQKSLTEKSIDKRSGYNISHKQVVVQDEIVEKEKEDEITESPTKSTKGKVVRQRDFCYFCESLVLNFARHIQRSHSMEIEVKQILSKPVNSTERKTLITALRKRGNYLDNLDEDCKKPVKKSELADTIHLPCPFCLGFYSKKQLWRHKKKCIQNPNRKPSTLGESQSLLAQNMRIDERLVSDVFPHMRADQVSLVAKKDLLICEFGARYLKIHREKHFIPVVSRKMRELARLLTEVRKLDPNIHNLFQALKPQTYDLIVHATKLVARYNTEDKTYRSPTYAMNISKSLKDCCDIAINYALKRKDVYAAPTQAENDLKTLIQLLNCNWQYDISSLAAADLSIKKWNKITIIPLASDLKILKEYLSKISTTAAERLGEQISHEKSFKLLLETVFCKVILLNRRRPGELQRLLITTYLSSSKQKNYEEFQDTITPTERVLIQKFKRIVIRGKRGRGVPVLFSEDVQEQIKILLLAREEIFRNISNPYLFGWPGTCVPLVGYKVLEKHAKASGAKNPKAITATRLRKHLATITQILNMSDTDVEQLANFMGHTDKVHRGEYRLPDDVYQTAKISKILVAMESGSAGQFKGKCLDEIEIDMEEDLLGNDSLVEDGLSDRYDKEDEVYNNCNEKTKCKEQNQIYENLKTKPKRVLTPWSKKEKDIVYKFFKEHIKTCKPPKKAECMYIIEQHPEEFKHKTWTKIKVFIQNTYTNKQKYH